MNKIILLCGESGSGKTTIAQMLEESYNLKILESYTTRPRRKENEIGHIFLTDEQFGEIKVEDIAAYTEFDGHKYCATQQQVEESDVYIVDKTGIETFKNCYKGNKKPIVLYIKTQEENRKKRMLERGDSLEKIEKRLENDRNAFKDIELIADYVINNDSKDLISLIRKIWLIYINQ